jgi:hypothetical protein
VDAARDRIYCCDTLRQKLIAFDRSGKQQFSAAIEDLQAVAIDEKTGDIWCLEARAALSGELLVLDVTGNEKSRYPIAGLGISYSPSEDAFWVVGKSVVKINRDGQVLCTQPLFSSTFAFRGMVVDRERGGAWVLDDLRTPGNPFQSQLWKVTPDGKPTVVHKFAESTLPLSLICVDSQPWVVEASSTMSEPRKDSDIEHFDAEGKSLGTIPVPAQNITIGVQSGVIWAQTKDQLIQLNHSGRTERAIPNPNAAWCVQVLAF